MNAASISQLEPRLFWKYFAEITRIPRCSRHLDAIRKYVQNVAEEHGLSWKEDAAGNIVVYKEGSSAGKDPVLLQAHLDMVCVARPGSEKDMLCEPPIPVIDGDWVRAQDSSLGGDDGVGVALILAILSSSFSHPPIEALFTIDEEIGLVGAQKVDARLITAKRMINLDSEDESVFTIAAAGGNRSTGKIPVSYEQPNPAHKAYTLVINGLLGGHSGVKIHEGRANSIVLFARLFHYLSENAELRIASLHCGGLQSNVIPSRSELSFTSSIEIKPSLIDAFTAELRHEYDDLEPKLEITLQKAAQPERVLKLASTQRILALVTILPCGVLEYSKQFSGVVESSVNISYALLEDETCTIMSSQRSLFEHSLDYYTGKVETCFRIFGGSVETVERYASWPPQKKENLVDHLIAVYEDMFKHRQPTKQIIHAGLECGEVLKKVPGIEVVSIGADMEDVHSVNERICISSIARMWSFLQNALERL